MSDRRQKLGPELCVVLQVQVLVRLKTYRGMHLALDLVCFLLVSNITSPFDPVLGLFRNPDTIELH